MAHPWQVPDGKIEYTWYDHDTMTWKTELRDKAPPVEMVWGRVPFVITDELVEDKGIAPPGPARRLETLGMWIDEAKVLPFDWLNVHRHDERDLYQPNLTPEEAKRESKRWGFIVPGTRKTWGSKPYCDHLNRIIAMGEKYP